MLSDGYMDIILGAYLLLNKVNKNRTIIIKLNPYIYIGYLGSSVHTHVHSTAVLN